MPDPTAPTPCFVRAAALDTPDNRLTLAQGLMQPHAAVSPKYLYDALGSALFVAITELPEYYPTRTEAAIMRAHGAAIIETARSWLPAASALVDLGAGDGAKAERLFDLLRPARYVAVDVAEDFMRRSLGALQQRHPDLPMTGVVADFAQHLSLPVGVHDGASLVFYPGSSIGNFPPADAVRLLSQARDLSRGGALLIGADLVKPAPVLEAAYDDGLGVTAAFNLNVLRHLNQQLGCNFDVRDWQHVALFDPLHARIEMHLQARRAVTVAWPGHERRFAADERIHTEYSYKWTQASFKTLLHDAGWQDVRTWTDPDEWFGVFLARA